MCNCIMTKRLDFEGTGNILRLFKIFEILVIYFLK